MLFFGLLMGLLLIFLLGGIIVLFLDKNDALNAFEKLALSFLIGSGAISLILFWLSFFCLPYKIIGISAVIIAIFMLGLIKKQLFWKLPFLGGKLKFNLKVSAISNWRSVVWLLIFIIIVLKISYAFVEATSKPEYSWDACSHWTYPGKVIYDLDKRGFGNIPSILVKFPDHVCHYPKMLPYLHYWLFGWMGQANDQWSKIFFPLALLCFVVIFYSALKQERNSLGALFFVWLLLSGPLFLYHATFGYSDLTCSLYFSTGIIIFYRWIKQKQSLCFYLFAIFSALATWIKNEGSPLYFIGFVILMVYLWYEYDQTLKQKIIKLIQYLIAYLVIGFPWQLYLKAQHVASLWNFELHYDYLPTLCRSLYGNLFIDGSWGVFWLGAVAAFILFYKNLFKQEKKYLASVILLFFFIFPLVYLSFDMYTMSGAAINRQWLNIYPVVIFALGCVLKLR